MTSQILALVRAPWTVRITIGRRSADVDSRWTSPAEAVLDPPETPLSGNCWRPMAAEFAVDADRLRTATALA
jgi:hypothetical protein